jgi:hypothetical protein
MAMVIYTADSTLRNILEQLDDITEIRDASGAVVGYFAPASHEEQFAYARAAAHFDPQELARRKSSGNAGSPTREVLARVQAQPRK